MLVAGRPGALDAPVRVEIRAVPRDRPQRRRGRDLGPLFSLIFVINVAVAALAWPLVGLLSYPATSIKRCRCSLTRRRSAPCR
jgi:hypothetical protein